MWLTLACAYLLPAQNVETDIKVYNLNDGLSHRNVFCITQDTSGFLWMATINGLNRFDGYEFRHYRRHAAFRALPVEFTSHLARDERGRLWVSSPDFVTRFDPLGEQGRLFKIKRGEIVPRQSLVPTALEAVGPDLWMTTYDEVGGTNALQQLKADGTLFKVLDLPGPYVQRPLAHWGNLLFVGGHENELWILDGRTGRLRDTYAFPAAPDGRLSRIADLQVLDNQIWVLLSDGRLFVSSVRRPQFYHRPLKLPLPPDRQVQTLLVEEDGDIWVGGLGMLWQYDAWQGKLVDHDASIRQLVKNTCAYRQIFRDLSGTIWIASDFGAISIAQTGRLFTHYLAGGSEYCNNVQCSTRGITEDDQGRIYITYYNSIHVLDPRQNDIRPLFPANDYFNYPFGILYHDGALYTGNGRRIRLHDLKVDTLFNHPLEDLGAVVRAPDGRLWFGYKHWLYHYDPATGRVVEYGTPSTRWDSLAGTISYLHAERNALWVATLNNGLYRLDLRTGARRHYHTGAGSPARLAHAQVNVIHADRRGRLWLGTGAGLQRLDPDNNRIETFTDRHGLPNTFVNGILPEGDSCLWLSTDRGLCRFSLDNNECLNFFTEDGLSADEFNRISFYRARNGRLYFGGLNGVNAFYPDRRYLDHKEERRAAPLLLTHCTYLDGRTDSLRTLDLSNNWRGEGLRLSYHDRLVTVEFTLGDYRSPGHNQYSYFLEGYDQDWSEPLTDHRVRYTDLPAGKYVLHVRGRAAGQPWSTYELALPIEVDEPYYRKLWFWIVCTGLIVLAVTALARYWLYLSERRRRELELQVLRRTRELASAKQKSEELLLNILPQETVEELKKFGSARAHRHEQVTVLFADFKEFSRIAEVLEPEELVAQIDYHFRAFDAICEKYGLEKIKTIGDAYLCVGGLPGEGAEAAVRTVKAALDIQSFMAESAAHRREQGLPVFQARIGLHTGPIVAGVVGTRKFAYDIWGETVNIASRMESSGTAGQVNISAATLDLVRDEFEVRSNGFFQEHRTRVDMYVVERPKVSAGERVIG